MPYSFYNVNQFNNTFEISANNKTVNFNLLSQNYPPYKNQIYYFL